MSDGDVSTAATGRPRGLFAAVQTTVNQPYLLMVLLSFALIGGDRLAVSAGGMNFRAVALTMVAALFMQALKGSRAIVFDRTMLMASVPLCLAAFLSIRASYSPMHSIGYTGWLFFTLVVVVGTFYNFARWCSLQQVSAFWLWAYRLHAIATLVEIPLHKARPHLWFYETSYLAVFLTGYFGAALYLAVHANRRYSRDVVLALVAMASLFSATAFVGIALALLLNVALARRRLMLILKAVAGLSILVPALYLAIRNSKWYWATVGFLQHWNGDALNLLLILVGRSGNRYLKALWGLEAFQSNWVTGIGIGADKVFTSTQPLPLALQPQLYPWLSVINNPFTNPFIEVMGTMGIFGLMGLVSLLIFSIIRYRQVKGDQEVAKLSKAVFVSFFSLLLVMQAEGTFLRFYIWAAFGLALGLAARHRAQSGTPFHEVSLGQILAGIRRHSVLAVLLCLITAVTAVAGVRLLGDPVYKVTMFVVPVQSVDVDPFQSYVERGARFEGLSFSKGDTGFLRYGSLLQTPMVADGVLARRNYVAELGLEVAEGETASGAFSRYLARNLVIEGTINTDLIQVSLRVMRPEIAKALLLDLHDQAVHLVDEQLRSELDRRLSALRLLANAERNADIRASLIDMIAATEALQLGRSSEYPPVAEIVSPPAWSAAPAPPSRFNIIISAVGVVLLLALAVLLGRLPGYRVPGKGGRLATPAIAGL